MKRVLVTSVICLFALCLFSFYKKEKSAYSEKIKTKEALGKKLFFDPILSSDSSISCASCHRPEFAFADSVALSKGIKGLTGNRNTPSAMNVASRDKFFWDGRVETLQKQALKPIENPVEMNLPISEALIRLKRNADYIALFKRIYKSAPNEDNLGDALAAFENTLETSNSAWDKHAKGEAKMSVSAQRGRILFNEKAKCFDCHFGPDFTGDELRNIGLYDNIKYKDQGYYSVTKNEADLGKFKVPGLRNIAITAPYMHDGSFKTLREVIDYYNDPKAFIPHSINQDSLINGKLNLSEQEKTDLEAFLNALTDEQFLVKNE